MSEMPWVPFYPSDWLGGTRGLSAVETGVYITLIAMMYERDGPVPNDLDRLSRACGCTRNALKKAISVLVADGKVVDVDDGLFNDRAEKEIKKRLEKSQIARQNANARWSEKSEKTTQNQYSKSATASDLQPSRISEEVTNQTHTHNQIQSQNHHHHQSQAIGGDGGQLAGLQLDSPRSNSTHSQVPREEILRAIGADPVSGLIGSTGRMIGRFSDLKEARKWSEELGLLPSEVLGVIQEVMADRSDGPPSTFAYFTDAMRRYAAAKNRPRLMPIQSDACQ